MPAPAAVLRAIDRGFERTVNELIDWARIPSVSAEGFEPMHVERSAEALASLLQGASLGGVEILRLPGVHPYVVAEWMEAGGDAPRVLLYSHHDVQPPGRVERWNTPPFEPTRREDGRLYGRGIVDDKAGAFVHLAAIRAWLEACGALPVNVKILVEGEEEIGSGHLAEFLRCYSQRFDSDVIVLSDTANLATGLPSLTTSLRGLVVVDIHVRALDHPLHSGMWGGVVPDAATALASILGRLTDDDGAPAIPGLEDDLPRVDPHECQRLAALPFAEAEFRRDAGLPEGVRVAGISDRSVYERLWRRPSIAVTALEAMPLTEAASQLIAESAARVALRLAPGQDAVRARDLLLAHLGKNPPSGVKVELQCEAMSPGWQIEPMGSAFSAAERALGAGFGCEAVYIGCGGTIPFVGPFADQLGDVPVLLLGLEDPACNAHGENESLDLDDFRKAIYSVAHLFAELADAELGR